uniref:Uncharacterized protein n=1 Tax=Solanum tuberosum TaxID=4113 RepID=M1DAP5_SOLTU
MIMATLATGHLIIGASQSSILQDSAFPPLLSSVPVINNPRLPHVIMPNKDDNWAKENYGDALKKVNHMGSNTNSGVTPIPMKTVMYANETVRHKQHELKTIREESQKNHQEVSTKDWVLTSFNKQQDINVSNNNSIANQQEAYKGTDTCPVNKDLRRGEETTDISSYEVVASTDEVVNTTVVSSNKGKRRMRIC